MLEIFCISQPSSLNRRGMSMKQISLSTTRFELAAKRTRKRVFLDEMILVVPWSELVGLIEQHAPVGRTGRPPFEVSTMLRCTAANVNDVTQGQRLAAWRGNRGVCGCWLPEGATKRPEFTVVEWHVAMRPGKRRVLDIQTP